VSAKQLVNSSPNMTTLGVPTPQAAHHSPLFTLTVHSYTTIWCSSIQWAM